MINIFFDKISGGLQEVFRKFSGKGKITEKDLDGMLREIKMTFLDADVNFNVVKALNNNIAQKAKGAEVLKSLTPDQQIIKIINDELIEILGFAQAG